MAKIMECHINPIEDTVFKGGFTLQLLHFVTKNDEKEYIIFFKLQKWHLIKLNMYIPKTETNAFKLYLAFTNIIQ